MKTRILRRDGRIGVYNVKRGKGFYKKYKKAMKKGRFIVWRPTKRRETRKKDTLKENAKKERTAMDRSLKRRMRVSDANELIDRTSEREENSIVFERKFSDTPTLQDSWEMYEHWLKQKGLADTDLIKKISAVDKTVLQDRITAHTMMYNKNGKFIGELTSFGILPHNLKTILDKAENAYRRDESTDSPKKLLDAIRDGEDELLAMGGIRGTTPKLTEKSDDYQPTRFETVFDFA